MLQNTKERFHLEIDDIPPSNNQYMGNQRNYNLYRNKKNEWKLIVRNALPYKLPDEPLKSAVVSIHYVFPDRRRRDMDNYSGKFLLDPLVEYGILADDNYTVLNELIISAEYKAKVKKTIIDIWNLDEKVNSSKEKIS